MNVKTEPSDGAVGNKSNAEEKKTDPSDGVKSNAKDLPPNDDPDPPLAKGTGPDTEVSLSSGKGKLVLYFFQITPLYECKD